MADNSIFDVNKKAIEKRMELGLKIMNDNYGLKELDTKDFKFLSIQKMDYTVRQFEVKGVGNLLVMTCPESEAMQMDSFVITPFFKNLPLMSTDYMYMKEKRMFLNEIYSLVPHEDETYNKYMELFKKNKSELDDLPDMPVQPCWYDPIRPVCTAKNTAPDTDDRIIELFEKNLLTFIQMEKELKPLTGEDLKKKWQLTQDYSDKLVDAGGVSTDVFKAVMGPEKTKSFFNDVFFGPGLYK